MNSTDDSRDDEYWTIKSVDDIQNIVKYTQSKGRCIYRGVNQVRPGDNKRVNSLLYRKYSDNNIWGPHYSPYQAEEEIVKKFTQSLPQYANHSNISILSDLRHFGHPVNVIDFSYNLYVALFFACHGETKNDKGEVINADGELYVLNIDDITTKKSIKYSEFETYPKVKVFYIDPVPTLHNNTRIMAQRSVFVYCKKGYIPLNTDDYDIVCWTIDKKAKRKILDELRTHHNIDQQSIYNDIVGFIANEENSKTSSTYFYTGNALLNKSLKDNSREDLFEAIKKYDSAIELNPKNSSAYFNRGVAHDSLEQYQLAITEYTKAIELEPRYANTYLNRGRNYSLLKEYERAITDLSKAIELGLDFLNIANAHYNRANVKHKLKDYRGAIDDFTKALQLGLDDKIATVAYHKLAHAKHKLKDYQGESDDLTKAINLGLYYPTTHLQRSFAYARLGAMQKQLGEKRKYYQRAFYDCEKYIALNHVWRMRKFSARGLRKWLQQQLDQQHKTDGE